MEFRSTLYMSALLVGAFICLHFYEESVLDEFIAHNEMLKKVIDKQKSSFDVLPYLIRHNSAKSDEDVLKLDLWNDDVKNLKDLVAKPSLENLNISKDLFTKYNIDKGYLKFYDQISYLTQFMVYDGILNQSSSLVEELHEKEKIKRQKDLHVIISQRQNNYTNNGTYELELEVVSLYNDVRNCDFMVEINGQKSVVHSFPYLLPKNTKTGFIIGDFKDNVTDERRTIRKNIFP